MDFAVYDTGRNYLVAELMRGAPVRGLLVDKFGSLDEDMASFDGEPRLGAVRLNTKDTARMASNGKFMLQKSDGEVVDFDLDAIVDWEFMEYAGLQSI